MYLLISLRVSSLTFIFSLIRRSQWASSFLSEKCNFGGMGLLLAHILEWQVECDSLSLGRTLLLKFSRDIIIWGCKVSRSRDFHFLFIHASIGSKDMKLVYVSRAGEECSLVSVWARLTEFFVVFGERSFISSCTFLWILFKVASRLRSWRSFSDFPFIP